MKFDDQTVVFQFLIYFQYFLEYLIAKQNKTSQNILKYIISMISNISLIAMLACLVFTLSHSQMKLKYNSQASEWTNSDSVNFINEKSEKMSIFSKNIDKTPHLQSEKAEAKFHPKTLRLMQTNFSYDFTSGISQLPNATLLAQLHASNINDQVIFSGNGLQTLEINNDTATNSTLFKINILNTNSTFNLTTFQLKLPGKWFFLKSSLNTFSCLLVAEQMQSVFRLIRFNNQTIELIQNFSISQSNYVVKIGQQCNKISYNGQIYNLGIAGPPILIQNPFYSTSSISHNSNFQYILWDNYQLYRYNSSSVKFDLIYTFDSYYISILMEWQNRIIVRSYQNNQLSSPQTYRQRIYIMYYDISLGKITIIDYFNYQYLSEQFNILQISPKLTKLKFGYYDAQLKNIVFGFKNIDYEHNYVSDLIPQDDSFHSIGWLNGILGDKYFIVRNNSLKNAINQTSNSTADNVYVENAYQFVGSNIVKLITRMLQPDELKTVSNIVIDPTLSTLMPYECYKAVNSTADLNLFQFDYGSYSGNLSAIITQIKPFIILNNSDHNFIGSTEKIQNMEIINNLQINSTEIKLNVLDSSSPSNLSTYVLNLPGIWNFTMSSNDTLSCSLIYEKISQKNILLQYKDGIFKQYYEIDQNQPNISLSNYLMYGINSLYNNYISQNCSYASFGGNIYNIDASINSTTYLVGIPAPIYDTIAITIADSIPSSSMKYLFSNNVLFKLNNSLGQYVQVYRLPYSSKCNMFNYQNRIVISCSTYNFTLINEGQPYFLSQSIYFLQDNDNNVQLLDVNTFTTIQSSYSNQSLLIIPIATSPKLTKIYYQYYPKQNQALIIIFRNIDYDNHIVYDVNFVDQKRFIATVKKFIATNTYFWTEKVSFKLGDHFLVLRNDSQFIPNQIQNTVFPSMPPVYVEQGYQFKGNGLVFLNSRILSTAEINKISKIIIDDSTNTLRTYQYCSKNYITPGFNIFIHQYGQFNGTLNQTNITLPKPFLTFNSFDNRFVIAKEGIQHLQIINNYNLNTSIIKLNTLNHSSSSNLKTYQLNLPGILNFIMSSNDTLSCNLIYDSLTYTYIFLRFKDNILQNYYQILQTQMNNYLTYGINDYIFNNYISQNCSFASFADTYLNIDASINSSTIITISAPGSNGQSGTISSRIVSTSMKYLLSNNILYKFNITSGEYVIIYEVVNFKQCDLFNYHNRIVISCASSIFDYQQYASTYNILQQSIYIIKQTNSFVQVLDIISFTAQTPLYMQYYISLIPIFTSPQLTKIYYHYYQFGSTTPTIIFKNIDFDNLVINDVMFINHQGFIDTMDTFLYANTSAININISNLITEGNFKLSDRFLVIRNDTQFSLSSINEAVNPLNSQVYTEEGYEFIGNSLVFVNRRIIPFPETNKVMKILIDSSVNTLLVLKYYPRDHIPSGYNIIAHDLGVFTGTVNPISNTNTPILTFPFSIVQNIFIDSPSEISSLALSTFSNNSFTATKIQYSSLNRSTPSNKSTQTLFLQAGWKYVKSSAETLSCSLLINNQTQQLAFLSIESNAFNILAVVNYSYFPVLNQSSTQQYIKNAIVLGEGCEIIRVQNQFYYIRSQNMTNIDLSYLLPTQRNYSSSLLYFITDRLQDSQLFAFNYEYLVYTPAYQMRTQCQYSKIFTFQNKTIISCQKWQAIQNQQYYVNITVYAFQQINYLQLLMTVNDTFITDQKLEIKMFVSPKLSKIYYQVNSIINMSIVKTITIKTVDFENQVIGDLEFTQLGRFQQTVYSLKSGYNMRNFGINDDFLVVRNDTQTVYYSVNGSSKVEEAYQFVNNSIIYVGTRLLRSFQIGKNYKMIIDPHYQNQPVVLNYYPTYKLKKEYSVFQNTFKNQTINDTNNNATNTTNTTIDNTTNNTNTNNATNTTNTTNTTITTNTTNNTATNDTNNNTTNTTNTTNITNNRTTNTTNNRTQTIDIIINPTIQIAPPPPVNSAIIVTFPSSDSGQFITSNRVQYLQLTNNGTASTFTIKSINRSNPTNSSSISHIEPGIWTYVSSSMSSLSCIVALNSITQAYGFFVYNSHDLTFQLKRSLNSLYFASSEMKLRDDCICQSRNYIYDLLGSISGLVTISPEQWIIQASSVNLQYIISNNILYEYNPYNKNFITIKTFGSVQNYQIIEQNGKIIISAYNSSQVNGLYTVNQIIYILEKTNDQLLQLSAINISAINNTKPFVPVYASPKLFKIHYEYISSNGSKEVQFKNINFQTLQVSNITFSSKIHYLSTTLNIPFFTKSNYFLGDYYLIIRNDTVPINATVKYVEEAYQFIGQYLIHLRMRELGIAEQGNCFKITIDDYYIYQLIVLDAYPALSANNSVIGLNLNQFTYGNLATTIKIIIKLTPSYISFSKPSFTTIKFQPNALEWSFTHSNSPNTEIMFYTKDNTAVSHYKMTKFVLPGEWQILAETSNCKILHQTTINQYQIRKFNSVTETLTVVSNLTTTINAITSPKLLWKISTDCEKISVDHTILILSADLFIPLNITSNLDWIDLDQSFTYALLSNSIWKYKSSSHSYQLCFNITVPFSNGATIMAISNRVVVKQSNNSSFKFIAFLETNSTLIYVANYSFMNYTSQPKYSISSNLTKIVIYGNILSQNISILRLDSFFIDYTQLLINQIVFPVNCIIDPTFTHILIQQNWIYIRQMQNPNKSIININSNLEYVYNLQQDIISILNKVQNISDTDGVNWVRTILEVTSNGDLNVYTQLNQGSSVSVLIWQHKFTQLTSVSSSTQAISSVIIGGQVKLCSPGCSDCTAGECSSCLSGFNFVQSSATCSNCGLNCLTCLQQQPNKCYSCESGTYLNNNNCFPCDSSCITCQTSAINCTKCLAGKYLNINFTCQTCPRNCLICDNFGNCTICNKGFAISSTGCRGCFISCSDCAAQDIMTCTACASGLQLYKGQCIQCPAKCKICNNGKCGVCTTGYHPNSNGKCVQDCQLPCASCQDDKPKKCTSCYRGSIIFGTTCKIDLNCNNHNNCTDCGAGTGYIIVGANCFKCGSINNCIQCRQTNSQFCALCSAGYYLNNTICAICPNECPSCVSQNICTSCQLGYTLPKNEDRGKCRACQHPCLTCEGTPNYCTSCMDGFTKKGWKCQNNINIGFSFVFNIPNVNTVLVNIDQLVNSLLLILKMDVDNRQAITFSMIQSGSVIVGGFGGTSSSSSSSVAVGSSHLSSACAGGSLIGGFPVSACNVVANGVADVSQQKSSEINLLKIIGLSIGVPFFLVIIISTIIYFHRKNTLNKQQDKDSQYKVKDDQSQDIILIEDLSIDKVQIHQLNDIEEPSCNMVQGKRLLCHSSEIDKNSQQITIEQDCSKFQTKIDPQIQLFEKNKTIKCAWPSHKKQDQK